MRKRGTVVVCSVCLLCHISPLERLRLENTVTYSTGNGDSLLTFSNTHFKDHLVKCKTKVNHIQTYTCSYNYINRDGSELPLLY